MVKIPLRYVIAKPRADGGTAYYWNVPTKFRKAGCPFENETLKGTIADVTARAEQLNAMLDAWRTGSDQGAIAPGTVKWLRREYEKDDAFKRLKRKSKQIVSYCLDTMETHQLESGRQFGDLRVADIARRHAKALRARIAETRGASLSNSVMRYSRLLWNFAIDELELDLKRNPFQRMKIPTAGGSTYAPTRPQVDAFIAKADELGFVSAGTAVMLAFELCQRPNDVIGAKQEDGSIVGLSWHDYRSPAEHGYRASLRVRQHKTGEMIWVPLYDLDDATGQHIELFPGLIDRLEATPKRGPLIIMRDKPHGRRKGAVHIAYTEYSISKFFREIADAAGLPKEVQFRGMRHGGLTELGDADVTDQEMMSISGHTDRQTLTVYSRRTSRQARNAARKRLALRMDMEQSSERGSEIVQNVDKKKTKKASK